MDPKALFYTREAANTGIRIPLFQPDGKPTEHFLQVRGVDSDAWHAAQAASRQRLMAASADPAKIEKLDPEEERITLLTALVMGWSFPDACTPEAVRAFLKEAPQIATEIDRIASNRRSFFAGSSNSSTPSPAPSSS